MGSGLQIASGTFAVAVLSCDDSMAPEDRPGGRTASIGVCSPVAELEGCQEPCNMEAISCFAADPTTAANRLRRWDHLESRRRRIPWRTSWPHRRPRTTT